eukprot:CAMPEP_0194377480 /NCGR_PEP_ID=MMETSP0174-20130528/31339_1 /TAXON_ID=216777 /ORGANISM="Proboscia alata, Strain PI-D3" /LENGTH=48 /DNA_ID= /DNA_START= /DNA_END= /DNA_ORIENTATION=
MASRLLRLFRVMRCNPFPLSKFSFSLSSFACALASFSSAARSDLNHSF